MGQVTIYVDHETEKRLKAAARESGLSVSKWISRLIRQKTSEEWPDGVRAMAGAWPDLPTAEELRRNTEPDLAREQL